MNLLDLPTEVLVMIAETLQNARDINTLARTSRSLYSCINHVLYKSDVHNEDGKALSWAAQNNKPATAKKSLQAGVKTLRQWHRKPLVAALKRGHEAMMRLLLDEGVDPDEILFDGSPMETTALYVAASNGHNAIVKLLIEKGASVNLRNAPGHPLVIAVSYKRTTAVRLLLEKGANPNAQRWDNLTALEIAVMRKSTEIVSMLLNKGAHTQPGNGAGTTPLQTAVMNNHRKITRLLLERGADMESRNHSGLTALDLGVTYGSQRALCALLQHGADLNAQNSWPLHAAIDKLGTDDNKIAMIRFLLTHGADINRKDAKGRTPLLHAWIHRKYEIVEFLLQYRRRR